MNFIMDKKTISNIKERPVFWTYSEISLISSIVVGITYEHQKYYNFNRKKNLLTDLSAFSSSVKFSSVFFGALIILKDRDLLKTGWVDNAIQEF